MEAMNPQEIIEKIENSDVNWIYNHFSEDFQEVSALSELEKLLKVYNERRNTNSFYKHIHINRQDEYLWFDEKRTTGVSVTLNKYNEIIGFVLLPIQHQESAKYSKLQYTMPIEEAWMVIAGGDNELLNHHYHYKRYRHAIDLVKVKDQCSYQGNPNQVINYYAYNLTVVAPANGEVVEIVDGIPDCVPGEFNMKHPHGNYIIMKHAKHEYSLIAHLKPNTVNVSVGDEIFRGQHIAKVGNSGNTSEPHIHFQIMDQKDIAKAHTLKIKLQEAISPEKGDIVNYTGDNILVEKEQLLISFIENIRTNILQLFKS
ncbi:M23 family metallopeptidase [Staphylococcus gallinarum]|uniref:lysostaphin n=1 Tax=Staphylococcus gallinarum TaxID=1293 RepID=A0A3A0VIP5_STAGA|nr:M23 family metallopeptidase [Staphylococcus gallinarum]RIP33636.1 M23 family metallopeptidase [Staphylococcus gallinarum]